ncbi:HsmA family protein [Brevibacillus daliensis]|uniref:HsmA family protein n=1 Tax=Brevibacillus daliensis TaxID=2892995 RepID=UPI001E2F7C87|nr:HsmA family protein [Brevibacillus daliensis]
MLAAVIAINMALIFYTIGVWSEKRAGELKKGHLGLFSLGLVCDVIGTSLMSMIANASGEVNFLHGLTGTAALVLMLVHTAWAAIVLWKKDRTQIEKFHRYSIFVWAIWLIPYFLGVGLSIFG